MKKIFVLICMLTLLVACGEEEQEIKSVFIGGTQGLILSFEDFGVLEEGVSSVYDAEEFPITINVKNKGEYNLAPRDLTVKIKGISLKDFQGITEELKNSQKIDGISEFNANGGELDLDFGSKAKYVLPVVGAYQPFDIFADAIYNYETNVIIPQVCFKENLKDISVCNVKESKTFSASGAPINVEAVQEDTAGAGIIVLKIVVKNMGTGKVTIQGEEFGTRYDKFAFSTPEGFHCVSGGNTNEAKFLENGAEIICKLKEPLAKNTVYVKPLTLKLSYNYKEQISKPIRILSQQS